MKRNLLWIDCTAGVIGGVAVLMLSRWLSGLHALPHGLVLFIGGVNLVYATYSFSLARRRRRPLALIKLLVFANFGWTVVCLALATSFMGSASAFGIGHLIGEAMFVGTLAGLEWRWRTLLLAAA